MPKRVLAGKVISNSCDQTVTVLVERRFMHPVMKKTVRKSKKYRAHDANNSVNLGDKVQIRECSPISKTKSWEVIETS
ncbi:MAG: 30S ribosomal protein S17 [Rhodobacteraceae bacterium]|nr:30S ribosomal protein S17 [Paracoccaceae bacterium]MYE37468.1 30S ribosomal protein S17 [Paracoccaceae bacterium]MYG42759.1 30S ribosomal protein S17 [Paracoccaceae bacterium]